MTKKNPIEIKPCKKVGTSFFEKGSNGWLLEIVSDQDGFTEGICGQMYLTVVAPHTQKGYHIHALATYHVTCIQGTVTSIFQINPKTKQEVTYGEGDFKTIKFAPGTPHLLRNDGDIPAYVLIYRNPAWQADIKEQLDIPPEEITTPEAWKKIAAFNKSFKK